MNAANHYATLPPARTMTMKFLTCSTTGAFCRWYRAESEGWYGVTRLRLHVLPARHFAVAEPKGGHQTAEVRKNQREKDGNAHRRTLQGISMYVSSVLCCLPFSALMLYVSTKCFHIKLSLLPVTAVVWLEDHCTVECDAMYWQQGCYRLNYFLFFLAKSFMAGCLMCRSGSL